jgi:putative peptidoglycan lipid II flippase
MGAGVLRSFQQANTLHQMPVSLIGVAISTAFFPQLTEELGRGDKNKFQDSFRTALRMIIWIALPVSLIAFFARGYIVNFIMNGGDMLIATILGTFIVAIFAQSIFHIASRGFYAYQDTKTPLIVSIIAIGTTIGLSILFYNKGYGPEGLGWAQSIGAVFEIIILLAILNRRSGHKLINREFFKSIEKMFIAGVITACVAYSMTKFLPLMATDNSFLATFPKFCVITAVSLVAYLGSCYFLNIPEATPIFKKIKKILFRNTD